MLWSASSRSNGPGWLTDSALTSSGIQALSDPALFAHFEFGFRTVADAGGRSPKSRATATSLHTSAAQLAWERLDVQLLASFCLCSSIIFTPPS